jgi:hypothetical protein
MKVTYFQTLPTRAGERIPVQDVEDGEKFRVVSQKSQFLATYMKDCGTVACKFKRRGDHLYTLLKSNSKKKEREYTWQKSVEGYFVHRVDRLNWMDQLIRGDAEIIVEIY